MTTPVRRRFPLLFASLLGFVLLTTLIWAENISDSPSGVVALLVFVPQHAFALWPLILVLVSALKRQPRCALINAVSLWLWAQWLLGWNVPLGRIVAWHPGSTQSSTDLRVMTFNVQRGERGVAGLRQIIDAGHPDILCLQETQDPPPRHFAFPGNVFETSWTGWHFARGGDVMTLSRFPLVSQRLWPLSGGRRILETVWQTPQGRVRVLNVHIAKSDAEAALQQRNASFALDLGANFQIAAHTRLEQRPALEAAIAGEKTLPLIMAGDFNCPPRGGFYRGLTAHLTDAWAQGGWGTGATFPSRWPLLRIDHIFLRGAGATRVRVPRSNASDHLPLVADVVLDGR